MLYKTEYFLPVPHPFCGIISVKGKSYGKGK